MSITAVVAQLTSQGTTKNATMTPFNTSSVMRLIKTDQITPKITESSYILQGDSPADQVYAFARREVDGRNVRSSIRVRAKVVVTDTTPDPDTIKTEYWETKIEWSHPGPYLNDSTVMNRLLEATVSLVLGSFDSSTGVPAGEVVSTMNYGVTDCIVFGS